MNHKARIKMLADDHYSDLDSCVEDIRIINCNPIDKKLLKIELNHKYSDYTIKLARKIIREKNKEVNNVR